MAVRIGVEARAAAEQFAETYMMLVSAAQRAKLASLMKQINWSQGVSERAKMAIMKAALYDVKDQDERRMAAEEIVDNLIGVSVPKAPTKRSEQPKLRRSLDSDEMTPPKKTLKRVKLVKKLRRA